MIITGILCSSRGRNQFRVMPSSGTECSANRLFLAEAARLGEFFTAHVSGDAKDLPGPDMSGIAYLVPVCPVKKGPQRLVAVDIGLRREMLIPGFLSGLLPVALFGFSFQPCTVGKAQLLGVQLLLEKLAFHPC